MAKKKKVANPLGHRGSKDGAKTYTSTSEKTKRDIQRQYDQKDAEIQSRAVGCPSKVRLDELRLIQYFARTGRTMQFMWEQVSDLREVNGEPSITYETFREWKNRYPEFFAVSKRWKDDADDEVEASLWELAVGARHTETKKKMVTYVDDETGECVSRVVEKEIKEKQALPNQQAIEFWLSNRRPEVWKKINEIKLDDVSKLSDAQLERLVAEEMTKETNEDPHQEDGAE